MTDELAAIEARHSTNMDDPEDDRWCQSEGEEWPCDTSKVLAALHVEQEARARVEDDYDHLVEVAREAAALLKRARLEQSIRHVHVAEAALRALIDPATPEPVRFATRDLTLGPWTRGWQSIANGDPPHYLGNDPRHPNELRIEWADERHTIVTAVQDWDGCRATPEPVEGEPTDMEPCDICDIRGGHDVHCIRYPHNRPRVTVIWKTAADRLAPDASEGEPTDG